MLNTEMIRITYDFAKFSLFSERYLLINSRTGLDIPILGWKKTLLST